MDVNNHINDLNKEYLGDLNRWILEYTDIYHKPPSEYEIVKTANNEYSWQIMNTLVHQFRLQKYNGKDIFTYTSWNHDIKRAHVFLEHEFRKYLRLLWTNKIPVICGE